MSDVDEGEARSVRHRGGSGAVVHRVDASHDSAFAALYEAHYRDVYRYVLCLTRSHEDAEDVAAEAFERAFRANLAAQVERRPLPFLLLTARRIATDRWRRARRLLSLTSQLTPASDDGAEGRSEFWLWFSAVAAAMPPRQREVLVLRYQRDLSDDDIGVVLGLTASGVRSLVARAVASLRSHPELLT